MRIAFVSREVSPLGGGGIGAFITAAANLLCAHAEVTIFTTSVFELAYHELRAAGDARLPDSRVRMVFVPEPTVEESEGWYHVMHAYGERLLAALRAAYPDGGPDLLECPDFLGEAFVPLQAAEGLDPLFAQTVFAVRMHTTAELCEVLDGFRKRDLGSRALHEMERFSLARADRVIWQGGDILDTYRRFYGASQLAPDALIRYPFGGDRVEPGVDIERGCSEPFSLLYAGRLERRKGVRELVRAVTGLERDDFRLTLHGSDTPTAPLGTSMRDLLELELADDPRVELGPPLDRSELATAIRAHDAVVVPSRWECWPYAALEPMHLNRPVLATPVGGLIEMVRPGESGWLSDGTDAVALEAALERVLAERAQAEEMIRSDRPLARARALAPDADIIDGYATLVREGPRRPRRPGSRRQRQPPPLVSAIVPYHRASAFARETVDSLRRQTYPRMEIVLVNDGSFEDADWLVAELSAREPIVVVTQMNQGLGAARNFGIGQSRGRYVLPLDADNVVEPDFVERCVAVLEERPEIAYVTSWSRYIGSDGAPLPGPAVGYQPLGNQAELVAVENVAGDAAAVLRRRVFDAGFAYSDELVSYEDWQLYWVLHRAGWYGAVLPERLLGYRVREDSMQAEFAQPNRERIMSEMDALRREGEMRWTSSSA